MSMLLNSFVSYPYSGVTWPVDPYLWYDPSAPGGVETSSGRVDTLVDLSGNDHDLTASGAARPYTGRTLNSLDVLDFQGAQVMEGVAGDVIGFDMDEYTIVFTASKDSSQSNKGFFSVHNGRELGGYYTYVSDWDNDKSFAVATAVPTSYVLQHASGGANPLQATGTNLWTGTQIIRFRDGGTNEHNITVSGISGGDVAVTNTLGASTVLDDADSNIIMGDRWINGEPEGTGYLDGYIGEVVIFPSYLSDEVMTDVRDQQLAKWSV